MKAPIWPFAFFVEAAKMALRIQNPLSPVPVRQPNGDTVELDKVSTLPKDLAQNSRF